MIEGYDIAQICPNGHVSNSSSRSFPDSNKPYCEKCGERTIQTCPECGAAIRGDYHVIGVIGFSEFSAPAFCINCGSPFPWTEKSIQAAIELARESGDLDTKEQDQFDTSIREIARDTPGAQLASSRLARLLKKMSKGTADAIKDIVVDIASETAKKVIWPDK